MKNLALSLKLNPSLFNLCRRRDLNSHPLRDAILSRARIPIPPLRPFAISAITRLVYQNIHKMLEYAHMPEPKPNLYITPKQENKVDMHILKNQYAQILIERVWKRMAKDGILNADNIIGTRETIENKDFEKFWQNVTEADIQDSINHYSKEKENQLSEFEKFKGEFNPSSATISSDDTSFFDKKISDLSLIKDSLVK